MNRRELLERIATFPLVTESLVEDLLSGDYRSVFRGQGIEFDEVRPYERGDDARSIDWNVSARFGSPYLKLYREERELTVFVLLDTSASMDTGGGPLSRRDQGTLAAALIALSAERAGERLGGLLFDGESRRFFVPRKGRAHAMAFIEAAVSSEARGFGPSQVGALGAALAGTARILKRRSLIVVVSDFACADWERDLGVLARRHDVVAVRLTDPTDGDFPAAGLVLLADEETGATLAAPTGFASFREAWAAERREREEAWLSACRRRSVACVNLSTDQDAVGVLGRFFGSRRRA